MNVKFLLVVIGGIFYVLGQYVATQPEPAQITVQGEGEVSATPDIGKISLGVSTPELLTSEAATNQLGEIFTVVASDLKALGIEEKDIRTTDLSVQPVYDFNDGVRKLRGYQASETVQVTIRDLNQAGEIVSRATREGVNQVGGISFDIDDPESLQQEAQAAAVADAKANAQELAQALGASLGKIRGFSIGEGPMPPVPFLAREQAFGIGGDDTVPPVPTGEQEIKVNVSVTYELK